VNLGVLTGFLTALSTFGSLLLALYLFWKTNRRLDEFSGIADSAGVSSGLAQSMKMSVLGQMSGPARLDKGLKGAMAVDVVENQMPIVNLIGDVFGINTKKYISKHPEAMLQLAQKFAPQLRGLMGGISPGSNPDRGNDGVGYG